MPFSARMSRAGWPSLSSKAAVTWPCSAPCRTKPASPRAPSASANASSRIDLPAPVSPVSIASPAANSMSRRSIRTMSRIDRRMSMNSAAAGLPERPADPGALGLARLEPAGFHQPIGVRVPRAVREIVAQHCGGSLRLVDDAERHIDLGEPHQRLLAVARRLILGHHDLEPVDRACVVALLQIITADRHLLAGQLIPGDVDLALGACGIFAVGEFADHVVERGERSLG